MITRRNFCKTCGIMTMAGVMAPTFLAATVAAAPASLAAGKKALVVVQMTGGNDGLNTLVPYADSAYHTARPTLGLKDDGIIKLNDQLALHASLKELKTMYDNGQMAIVAGAGYPNPNYSHFRSMEIWQSANPDSAARDGWLGRYLNNSTDPTALTKLGMTIGNTGQGGGAPLAFSTEKTVVLSFGGIQNFQFRGDNSQKGDKDAQLAAARKIYGLATQNSTAEYIRTTALDALNASDSLAKITTEYKPAVTYPKTPFADRLQQIAQILNSDYGTRIFYVATDGSYDTHFNQALTQARLHQTLAEGLSAFYQDLQAHNLADSVLTMTFSEFGRRVAENGSKGTDHGSAEPMFILGGKNALKPGIYGKQPSLTDLDNGNMKVQVDFRSVYGTVLQKWLGADPTPVVGAGFPALDFIS
ncbi:MAG: DUF1501 domain-containing protein [Chloroflexi bacterium]|nr:DUF1501 domain-containing protein [Chloroflexota bacterium]